MNSKLPATAEIDELERIALKGDLNLLNEGLKTIPIFVARRPRRFLDPTIFTKDQLLEQIRADSKDLGGEQFEPWILELNGKRRLPVFSSQQKMQVFAERSSKELNKVFSLACIQILLPIITQQVEVDFIDLNLFSEKSWEIEVPNKK